MERDLHIIRKLINDFAHNPLELAFDSPSVKSRVDELDKVANLCQRNQKARTNIGQPGAKHDSFMPSAGGCTALQSY